MIAAIASNWRRLCGDGAGSMVIETAIVAPVLAILALGGFEASRIVARQAELQTAAAEAVAIVRASPDPALLNINTVRQILETSAGLETGQVLVTLRFRCGDADDLVTSATECASGESVQAYLLVRLSESYDPIWTDFGIGETIQYRVQRQVFVG